LAPHHIGRHVAVVEQRHGVVDGLERGHHEIGVHRACGYDVGRPHDHHHGVGACHGGSLQTT
jgi:hypothetical protein